MKTAIIALLTMAAFVLPAAAETVEVNRAMLGMFQPISEFAENPDNPATPEKIDLGRMLYYDTRLSANRTVSCNTCHALEDFGDDGLAFAEGIHGHVAPRGSPTVYNAALGISQFWDGRAKDVEEQALGPILAAGEMGMPEPAQVLEVLKTIPGYVEAFKKAFPEDEESLTYENVGKAIGAFERGLLTPAPFDDYLAGNDEALSDEQKHGLNLFMTTGCTTCHNGMGVGGHMYQKRGLVKAWPSVHDDIGRAAVTENDAEKYFFKVPTLRNIVETAPYLHDGSIETIEETVAKMAEHQLGRELPKEDVKSIVTFLESLTGTIDEDYIAVPELPEDGPSTPKEVKTEGKKVAQAN